MFITNISKCDIIMTVQEFFYVVKTKKDFSVTNLQSFNLILKLKNETCLTFYCSLSKELIQFNLKEFVVLASL